MATSSIVLIDGEHYPAVTARAIKHLKAQGEDPVAALLIGGGEKLGQTDLDVGIPVEVASDDPEKAVLAAIQRHGVARVIDLSDEPVLGYVRRTRMASIALYAGASYEGPGFSFTPPPRPTILDVPSVGIIGTGKRTGKTAVAGAIAQLYKKAGLHPVVVAMGRGGPPEPEVLDEGVDLDPKALLKFVEQGRHASSDYIEDALVARVPAVGAWRAGGGLAGAVGASNYTEALEKAKALDPGLVLLEGSGAAMPPSHWDAGILIVNAGIDPGHLCGYFGLYRLLLSDLVVLTMVEESIDQAQLAAVETCIRSGPLTPPRVVRTVFRPHPLGDISGKKIWVATTAPEVAGNVIKNHLQDTYDAEVLAISHSLADRKKLSSDLGSSDSADVLVVELKAAAVDVVVKHGLANDKQIVFLENQPQPVGVTDLSDAFMQVAQLARDRFEQ